MKFVRTKSTNWSPFLSHFLKAAFTSVCENKSQFYMDKGHFVVKLYNEPWSVNSALKQTENSCVNWWWTETKWIIPRGGLQPSTKGFSKLHKRQLAIAVLIELVEHFSKLLLGHICKINEWKNECKRGDRGQMQAKLQLCLQKIIWFWKLLQNPLLPIP